jgi:hypothetical protein
MLTEETQHSFLTTVLNTAARAKAWTDLMENIPREDLISLCYATLRIAPNSKSLATKQAEKILAQLGFTGKCEDCGLPCAPVCRWCPSCLEKYIGDEEHIGLSLLIPRDEDDDY